jgi:hypothetical protein
MEYDNTMFVTFIIICLFVGCLFCSGLRLSVSGLYFNEPKAIHLFRTRGMNSLESAETLRQRARSYYLIASAMLGLFLLDAVLPISIF